jgi:hypothetical protein
MFEYMWQHLPFFAAAITMGFLSMVVAIGILYLFAKVMEWFWP